MLLVGCGDDDDAASSPTSPASPSPEAAAATPAPVTGGTVRFPLWGLSSADPPTIYPFENVAFLTQTASSPHYSRLLRNAFGPGIGVADHTKLEGDLAQGLPEQPDPLTFVFTFKPGITWHDKAPMNGRAATAGDFVQTYDAFLERSQGAANWRAFIDRMEATDETHLRITLKSPYAPFLTTHASSPEALWFVPVETIDNGQVQSDPVGTGPFVFREWENGVAIRWDRNSAYFDVPRPSFDQLEASLQKDPQRILSGLQSGDLDWSLLTSFIRDEAVTRLDPGGQEIHVPAFNLGAFFFNFDVAPWGDARVRRALSMALDREGYLSIQDKTGEGDWFSYIPPGLAPFFLSPRGAEFGPAGDYFRKNASEARKLLAAAGFEDGLKFTMNCSIDAYGAEFQQKFELFASTISEAGFTAEINYQPYASYVQSTYLGKFTDGCAVGPMAGSPRDPDSVFSSNFSSSSARHNWGGTPPPEMAELDARIAKQRTIMDLDERIAYIRDMQRWMAEWMPTVPYHANPSYGWVQPWMRDVEFKAGYGFISDVLSRWSFSEERAARG